MAIRIITDSAADYTLAEIEKRKITCVPMTITFGDQSYQDCFELGKDEFFEKLQMESELPRTSQPSPAGFLSCFEEAKEAGDTVIAILISSALSGTLQSAMLAKDMAEYDKYVQIFREGFFLLFLVGLFFVTKKLISWQTG